VAPLSWNSRVVLCVLCTLDTTSLVSTFGAIRIFSYRATVTKNEMLGEWAASHVDLARASIQQADAGQ
jgi:hypothetical protein